MRLLVAVFLFTALCYADFPEPLSKQMGAVDRQYQTLKAEAEDACWTVEDLSTSHRTVQSSPACKALKERFSLFQIQVATMVGECQILYNILRRTDAMEEADRLVYTVWKELHDERMAGLGKLLGVPNAITAVRR